MVEWLGQKENPQGKGWATGVGYGGKIITILNAILATAGAAANPAGYPENLTSGYYRVRKSWADAKTQIGAYRNLSNAKAQADKHSGYSVFSDAGVRIYPAAADHREYTVVKGDSLWGIAQKLLGDGGRFQEIKSLNGLTSDTIFSGQKLKIPKV